MPTRKFSFMDVVNQWMITFALFAFCVMVFWQPTLVDIKKKIEDESDSLQEIERSVKNAATKEQVETLTNKVKALDQLFIENMEHPEKWPQLNHQMKLLSPQR